MDLSAFYLLRYLFLGVLVLVVIYLVLANVFRRNQKS